MVCKWYPARVSIIVLLSPPAYIREHRGPRPLTATCLHEKRPRVILNLSLQSLQLHLLIQQPLCVLTTQVCNQLSFSGRLWNIGLSVLLVLVLWPLGRIPPH